MTSHPFDLLSPEAREQAERIQERTIDFMYRVAKMHESGELAKRLEPVDTEALTEAVAEATAEIDSNPIVVAAAEQAMIADGFGTATVEAALNKIVGSVNLADMERLGVYMSAVGVLVVYGEQISGQTLDHMRAAMPDADDWLPTVA